MSPFAKYIRQLRIGHGYNQKSLAYHLGYEPSYISALERGQKGPPKQDFINRLTHGLQLTEEEQATLAQALRLSRRHISLPSQASEQEYILLHQLEPHLGHLSPLQIQLIELALHIRAGQDHHVQPST